MVPVVHTYHDPGEAGKYCVKYRCRFPLRQLRQRSIGQWRVQSTWAKFDVISPCDRTVGRDSHFQKKIHRSRL